MVQFQRVDGEVRVTDRVTGATVRAVCHAVFGEPDDTFISIDLRTALSGEPIIHRTVRVLHHGVEADSIREMRMILRAFDAIVDRLPKETPARPEDIEVCVRGWNGPEPCDVFGEVATDGGEEAASWG